MILGYKSRNKYSLNIGSIIIKVNIQLLPSNSLVITFAAIEIRGRHLTCITAYECLNVHERVELVMTNKEDPLLWPIVL